MLKRHYTPPITIWALFSVTSSQFFLLFTYRMRILKLTVFF